LAFGTAMTKPSMKPHSVDGPVSTMVLNPPKIIRFPSKGNGFRLGSMRGSTLAGSFIHSVVLAKQASRIALSGHSIQLNAAASPGSALTAIKKSVCCPRFTSSPQHSTTRSAPNSMKIGSIVLAWSMNRALFASGQAITKPST
jgi:hypothetical protein